MLIVLSNQWQYWGNRALREIGQTKTDKDGFCTEKSGTNCNKEKQTHEQKGDNRINDVALECAVTCRLIRGVLFCWVLFLNKPISIRKMVMKLDMAS